MNKINFCKTCDRYTMQDVCPKCKANVELAKPPKYSPEDKWGEYRRRAKAEMAETADAPTGDN